VTGFLAPPDGPGVSYEFYAPFAHVPGRFEWCRIRSPTHGVFDTFIVLGASTAEPAAVYVNSALGLAFLQERFPECTALRVAPGGLRIEESPDGRTVTGTLQAGGPKATLGPVAEAKLELRAPAAALPQAVPYGGTGAPVWGSRFTCWGVDLALAGTVTGRVKWADGKVEDLSGQACIVTVGSFGRLAPR
jgi:hypothetical protein